MAQSRLLDFGQYLCAFFRLLEANKTVYNKKEYDLMEDKYDRKSRAGCP